MGLVVASYLHFDAVPKIPTLPVSPNCFVLNTDYLSQRRSDFKVSTLKMLYNFKVLGALDTRNLLTLDSFSELMCMPYQKKNLSHLVKTTGAMVMWMNLLAMQTKI